MLRGRGDQEHLHGVLNTSTRNSIDYELLLSAMMIGTESKEASCRFEPQEDFGEML